MNNVRENTKMLRTNQKQQLQRDQLMQQFEKKETTTLSDSESQSLSSIIRVPLYTSPTIPNQIFMVRSNLINPTNYHIKHCQQRQVHQFLSQSHRPEDATNLPTSTELSAKCDADPVGNNNLIPGIPNNSAATTIDEYEDRWQDVTAVTSSTADSGVEPSFNIDPFSESDLMEMFSFIPNPMGVSTSCPPGVKSDEGEIFDDRSDTEAAKKDRQKKNNHNKVERNRRDHINDRIRELRELLPRSTEPFHDVVKDMRINKGSILKASVEYVKLLKGHIRRIPELESRCRNNEDRMHKVLLRIQELELQLKSNNIPVSQSIWHPASESDIKAIVKPELNLRNGSSCARSAAQGSAACISQVNHEIRQQICSTPRPGFPIMQFLTVERELSSAKSTPIVSVNRSTAVAQLEDPMMEDNHPVTGGDVMLSSRDSYTPEGMEFI